jgi:hypothetical protein
LDPFRKAQVATASQGLWAKRISAEAFARRAVKKQRVLEAEAVGNGPG